MVIAPAGTTAMGAPSFPIWTALGAPPGALRGCIGMHAAITTSTAMNGANAEMADARRFTGGLSRRGIAKQSVGYRKQGADSKHGRPAGFSFAPGSSRISVPHGGVVTSGIGGGGAC